MISKSETKQQNNHVAPRRVVHPINLTVREAVRHARKERVKNVVMYVCMSLLMWTALFFTMAGVYFWRVEGLAQAWLFFGISASAMGLLLGAWCASSRFRKMWRTEA